MLFQSTESSTFLMRSVISISDLCWDISAFTSEYVSLMMAKNMFYTDRNDTRFTVLLGATSELNIWTAKTYFLNYPTHHENKENEEDKRGEVDGSEHWVCILNLRELKVSQNDAELSKTTQTTQYSIVCWMAECFTCVDCTVNVLTCWLGMCWNRWPVFRTPSRPAEHTPGRWWRTWWQNPQGPWRSET